MTSGDSGAGKALFQAKCAACHTLADAHTQGTVGPNLDDAFSSDKQQGFSVQTMKDIVRGQIAYPELPMRANLVRGKEADDVATYVATCAANPNCGVRAETHQATAPTTTSSGAAAKPDGKQVFASAGCATCHTLKAAGATGTIGPNLDKLKPSQSRVQLQVTNGGAIMPAFKSKLSAAQIAAVAQFVSQNAGK